jgi:hypothetical protein
MTDVSIILIEVVNLGLRWDSEGGTRERYGRTAVFNPEVASPLS